MAGYGTGSYGNRPEGSGYKARYKEEPGERPYEGPPEEGFGGYSGGDYGQGGYGSGQSRPQYGSVGLSAQPYDGGKEYGRRYEGEEDTDGGQRYGGGDDHGRRAQSEGGDEYGRRTGYGSGGGDGGQRYGGGDDYGRPPQYGGDDYGSRPQQGGYGRNEEEGRPQQQFGQSYGTGGGSGTAVQGQVVKIFCEANPDFYLTVKNDQLVVAPGNQNSMDQQFVKDGKWGSRVQDEAGFSAFAIVHRATGLALKHGSEMNEKVTLAPYNSQTLDESLLWTQSADVGDGYQCLRPVGNIHLNLDVLHGDQGINKPTELILFKWKKQPNQKWKMIPMGGGHSDY